MPRSKHQKGRHTYYSLYNLVAGRHRLKGYDPTRTSHSGYTGRALAPDEYLLRRWTKLQLYPFEDHRDLPDNALVMAIHWYISKRAAALGPSAFETMDASCLLAIAVEVEEQIKAALGKHGHLAYAQTIKSDTQLREHSIPDTDTEEDIEDGQADDQQDNEARIQPRVEDSSEDRDSIRDSQEISVTSSDDSSEFEGDSITSSDTE